LNISEEESSEANIFIQQELYGLGERVSYNPLDFNLGLFDGLKRSESVVEETKKLDLFSNAAFHDGTFSNMRSLRFMNSFSKILQAFRIVLLFLPRPVSRPFLELRDSKENLLVFREISPTPNC
jgi:hypothetical protein